MNIRSYPSVQELLDQVRFALGTLREAKNKFAAQLAPDFRIFDYLRDDEMGLSKCFADLLNPNGRHGQGRLFFDAFLELIEWKHGATNCKVEIEKQANGMRRIDVFLRLNEGLIGIENKPWAGDQKDQLSDYADYLADSAKDKQWKLIYLCNEEPSTESISADKRQKLADEHHFVQTSYDEIVDWLEVCATKTKALVVRVYVEELVKFIRSAINQEQPMSELIEIEPLLFKSEDSLRTALDIATATRSLKKQLIKKLKDDVYALTQSTYVKKIETWWDISSDKKWSSMNFYFHSSLLGQEVKLRFEFENKNYNGLFWGIGTGAKHHKPMDKVIASKIFDLMKIYFLDAHTNNHWSYYSNANIDGIPKDWESNAQIWMAIKNGNLAKSFLLHVQNVCAKFNPS